MATKMTDTVEDGVRVVRYPGANRSVKFRADCPVCIRYEERGIDPVGGFFPDHQAMASCRSGGRDHCTCDGCF